MTVTCWCCGQPSDGVNLHTTVPAPLKEKLDDWCREHGTSISEAVQHALALLVLPPVEER